VSDLVEFTVARDNWLRGDPSKSLLLNDEGGRCCVGFFMQQIHSIPDDRLRGICYVSGIDRSGSDGPFGQIEDALQGAIVYLTNDYKGHSDAVREATLAEGFAALGYRPIFVDGEVQQ
jgi:hypothetical protein